MSMIYTWMPYLVPPNQIDTQWTKSALFSVGKMKTEIVLLIIHNYYKWILLLLLLLLLLLITKTLIDWSQRVFLFSTAQSPKALYFYQLQSPLTSLLSFVLLNLAHLFLLWQMCDTLVVFHRTIQSTWRCGYWLGFDFHLHDPIENIKVQNKKVGPTVPCTLEKLCIFYTASMRIQILNKIGPYNISRSNYIAFMHTGSLPYHHE